MKTLIVDDDFTNRLLLQEILKRYGSTHIAINSKEAVEAARLAIMSGENYDLICLDIMMPELDGQVALKEIRDLEHRFGHKIKGPSAIVMTTALNDSKSVFSAFKNQCDGYILKPIVKAKLVDQLEKLNLISKT